MELPRKFIDEMKKIVPDFDAFMASYNYPPAKAFRINNAKIGDEELLAAMRRMKLSMDKVENGADKYAKVPFADHCHYLSSDEKWGNHPFHHAGLMYIQEPSAMAAIGAYDVKAELALDMCAAPGGKSIQLADKVGYLVANEVNPSRATVLKGNIERMGLKNVAVTNCFPSELTAYGEIFDLVLIDAPCSGEGMFRKDETAALEWSEEHSISCAARQAAILESADKVLKKGGKLIYSTCTFSRRENEDVVADFLDKHDYDLIEPSEEACRATSFLTDKRMRRFYPHLSSGEGQFFAGMIKRDGGEGRLPKENKFAFDKEVSAFLSSTLNRTLQYCEHDGVFYVPALPFSFRTKVVSGGVRIGKREGKTFKPDHYFFSAYGKEMFCFEPSEDELYRYLRGEELAGDHLGYGAITVLGAPLGGFKGSLGRYKNLYPKGLRRF